MNAIHLFAFQQLPDGIAYNKIEMKQSIIEAAYDYATEKKKLMRITTFPAMLTVWKIFNVVYNGK